MAPANWKDQNMAGTRFAGRGVMVFGAAGALGAGVAQAFAAEGAQVTGVDRAAPRQPLPGISHRRRTRSMTPRSPRCSTACRFPGRW
jgi:phosphoglycerate dehydrogenase-like enzyme